MMTRNEVAEHYTLDDRGIVTNRGKFEREPWWVVALWDAALEGFADETVLDGDTEWSCFALDADVAGMCGESVDPDRFVCVFERSDGFVFAEFLTRKVLEECEAQECESE